MIRSSKWHSNCDRRLRTYREPIKKVLQYVVIKSAALPALESGIILQVWPPCDVKSNYCQRIIHRIDKIPCAIDTFHVPKGFPKGLSEHDSAILDEVVLIHMDVPFCIEANI